MRGAQPMVPERLPNRRADRLAKYCRPTDWHVFLPCGKPGHGSNDRVLWKASRVFWLPGLVRGELHVEALPDGFPGGTAEGAVTLVEKLPGSLAKRFPNGSQTT